MYVRTSMKTTATDLRSNLYSLLDRVADTGEPIEIERKGVRLRIAREGAGSKLGGLGKRNTIVGEPEELLNLDWSSDWNPDVP
jgi:hypothetical protein